MKTTSGQATVKSLIMEHAFEVSLIEDYKWTTMGLCKVTTRCPRVAYNSSSKHLGHGKRPNFH